MWGQATGITEVGAEQLIDLEVSIEVVVPVVLKLEKL